MSSRLETHDKMHAVYIISTGRSMRNSINMPQADWVPVQEQCLRAQGSNLTVQQNLCPRQWHVPAQSGSAAENACHPQDELLRQRGYLRS